jgi:hypothetical protein
LPFFGLVDILVLTRSCGDRYIQSNSKEVCVKWAVVEAQERYDYWYVILGI